MFILHENTVEKGHFTLAMVCTVREIAVNPKKNAPQKLFIVAIVEFYSNASHQNDFQIGRHQAQIWPNSSNLSIGASKLLKILVLGTKCTRVEI